MTGERASWCKPFYYLQATFQIPPTPPKPSAGRPSKLSAADTHYAQQLISSGKAENASQITKTSYGYEEMNPSLHKPFVVT